MAFTLLAGLAAIPAVAGDVADLVIVEKAERRMVLMRGDTVLRTYWIALGDAPVGHKRQEGDERTPEGRYVLDWRNEKSSFHKSIHGSYPDADDRAAATKAGVDPGGMIMIHGQPNGFGWWSWLLQRFDWTDGCIAVTDQEMDEIWAMVKNGTAIEIRP
ncbi:L,D-transpeptidase family protein [Nitratireductor mangrovi]|nr:L,D-transpeptidase family protein [Nitratireductor mangrovi]